MATQCSNSQIRARHPWALFYFFSRSLRNSSSLYFPPPPSILSLHSIGLTCGAWDVFCTPGGSTTLHSSASLLLGTCRVSSNVPTQEFFQKFHRPQPLQKTIKLLLSWWNGCWSMTCTRGPSAPMWLLEWALPWPHLWPSLHPINAAMLTCHNILHFIIFRQTWKMIHVFYIILVL